MKIEVFEKDKKDDTLRVALKPYGGGVCMIVVDADGKEIPGSMIVTLRPSGLEVHSYVSSEIGLPREGMGRIVVKKEGE